MAMVCSRPWAATVSLFASWRTTGQFPCSVPPISTAISSTSRPTEVTQATPKTRSSAREDDESNDVGDDMEASRQNSCRPFFRIYYNDVYEVSLPPKHRFPMQKYRQTRFRVQEIIARRNNAQDEKGQKSSVKTKFQVSPMATIEQLETTHCPRYIQRYMTGQLTQLELRNVGFPWSPQGVRRSLSSTGGTIAAATAAVQEWIAAREDNASRSGASKYSVGATIAPWSAHIAGGTHHAFYDRGEGFCVFSDIAVAANVVLKTFPGVIRRILILDLDVHQGNGNAALFQNDPRVFTFSIHCEKNYFSKKEKSDLDVELPEGCDDSTYLSTLRHWLKRIRNEADSESKFDLIFFQAGVDILGQDRLGRMSLTLGGVQRRNDLVYEFARDLNVPLVITMGGGYPKADDWRPIIEAHADVYIQAHDYLNRLSVLSGDHEEDMR